MTKPKSPAQSLIDKVNGKNFFHAANKTSTVRVHIDGELFTEQQVNTHDTVMEVLSVIWPYLFKSEMVIKKIPHLVITEREEYEGDVDKLLGEDLIALMRQAELDSLEDEDLARQALTNVKSAFKSPMNAEEIEKEKMRELIAETDDMLDIEKKILKFIIKNGLSSRWDYSPRGKISAQQFGIFVSSGFRKLKNHIEGKKINPEIELQKIDSNYSTTGTTQYSIKYKFN